MFACKRFVLDGRIVVAVALCGWGLAFVWLALSKTRGMEDELLIATAVWAAGMALVLGWAMASVRRGPAGGRAAAGSALFLCSVGILCVVVRLATEVMHHLGG
jgi:hypothetical protein